jgi:peptidoglycan/LPS O-acetylase OafA/YrhL
MTMRTKPGQQYFPALDGLRALAMQIVIVSHVSNAIDLWGRLLGDGAGQLGVMLFFVLSGFLMGTLYLDKPFDRATLWNFVVRRFARLAPMFYFTVSVAAVLSSLVYWFNRDLSVYAITWLDLPYHFTFLQGADLFWTIVVEAHFYLVFIFLWWIYYRLPTAFFCIIAAGIALFFVLPERHYLPDFLNYYAFFLSGLLISRITLGTARWIWDVAFSLAVFATFLHYPKIAALLLGHERWINFYQMWHDPILLAVIPSLLLTALHSRIAQAILANRVMTFAGRISYSMYLLHMPVIICLIRLTPLNASPMLFLTLTLVITTIAASCTYYLIELPARRALRRFAV